MAAGEIGASFSPSRQSLGTSRAKVRLSESTAEKAKAIHRRPPESSCASAELGSKARLKITITSSAKTSAELKTSLVRNSARRSFFKMAIAAFQNILPTLPAPVCESLPRGLNFVRGKHGGLFQRETAVNARGARRAEYG